MDVSLTAAYPYGRCAVVMSDLCVSPVEQASRISVLLTALACRRCVSGYGLFLVQR